jgi:hypothetical protein
MNPPFNKRFRWFIRDMNYPGHDSMAPSTANQNNEDPKAATSSPLGGSPDAREGLGLHITWIL